MRIDWFFILATLKLWFKYHWEWSLGYHWHRAKDFFFIHVWHRRHVFNAEKYFYKNRPSEKEMSDYFERGPYCIFCGQNIERISRKKQSWTLLWVSLFLVSLSHAVSFDAAQIKRGFFYDSAQTFRVFTEGTACNTTDRCKIMIGDSSGASVSLPAVGMFGDTLTFTYDFPRKTFRAKTPTLTLAFLGGIPNTYVATLPLKMSFRDQLPPNALVRRQGPRQRPDMAFLHGFRLDGRVTP